jgi:hypothetical protein
MEFSPSRRLATLPLLLSLAFGGFIALPQIRANPILLRTFLITAGLLAAWAVLLLVRMVTSGRTPSFAVALLKQHYVQACTHTSILLYWGWYFRPVYDHAHLILAQLVFAYAFDMLLQLSRKGRYTLGFGPFPVIFSINLFLWFKDDWFYYQFLLIAVGFAAKELLHWTKGGKSVHIFNPSSFPLAIASWVLLLTHHFDITWGEAIAGTQYRPPHIYLFIFLVSLPGQFFFGVTTMIIPAVVTMYLWGMAYFAVTGTYYFYQAYIPIAVFLAMNLLFTDPSTSPRTELGRIFYGILYAGTVIILELTTVPAFPSKLLLVPALNLLVLLIDRAVQSPALRRFDPARIKPEVTGRRRNLATMAIWVVVFGVMSANRGIGDDFPGQNIPFWVTACRNQGGRACNRLAHAEDLACRADSGWGCNQFAVDEHSIHQDRDVQRLLSTGCQLRFGPACENAARFEQGAEIRHAQPTLADLPVLMSVFKWEKRPALRAMSPAELNARACHEGWTEACQASGAE